MRSCAQFHHLAVSSYSFSYFIQEDIFYGAPGPMDKSMRYGDPPKIPLSGTASSTPGLGSPWSPYALSTELYMLLYVLIVLIQSRLLGYSCQEDMLVKEKCSDSPLDKIKMNGIVHSLYLRFLVIAKSLIKNVCCSAKGKRKEERKTFDQITKAQSRALFTA